MHLRIRYAVLTSAIALQVCADVASSSAASDTWTILSPSTRWMSDVGANWTPSAQQVIAARDAARLRINRDAKTLRPVGLDESRLRDARDILAHWPSYRLQAWGYTKHHKKLIRLSFLTLGHWDGMSWRRELISVSDGGSAFWQADYDPSTGKILWWQA